MGWPFEHHQDGQVFLHMNNWADFKRHKDSGAEYPHNWLHRRLFVQIHSPRADLKQVPIPIEEGSLFVRNSSRKINCVSDDWSVIFEPYPAFVRTTSDLNGNQPSWHIWLEDKHQKPTYGEPMTLFSTGMNLGSGHDNLFAFFRDAYWYVEQFHDYGLGTKRPQIEELCRVGTKKRLYRSIDD